MPRRLCYFWIDEKLCYYFYTSGKNKFLLGDTPCQEDCAIFGLLGTLYWHGFGMRGETYIKSEYFKFN